MIVPRVHRRSMRLSAATFWLLCSLALAFACQGGGEPEVGDITSAATNAAEEASSAADEPELEQEPLLRVHCACFSLREVECMAIKALRSLHETTVLHALLLCLTEDVCTGSRKV